MIREFLFKANDAEGNVTRDTVVASDMADARAQLTRMGYHAIQIRADDLSQVRGPVKFNAGMAIAKIEREPLALPLAVLKGCGARWPDLLPGAAALTWTLWAGRSPWWGVVLLVAGLAWSVYKVLPTVAYTQLMWARMHDKFELGMRCSNLLRMLGDRNDAMAVVYGAERAKMIASLGRLEEGLALFAPYADRTGDIAYLTHVAEIHDAAGRRDSMMDVQRKLLAASGNSKEMRIALAWSLLHDQRPGGVDDVDALVAGIDPGQCDYMPASVLRIVRGLLDQADGQHAKALVALKKEHAVLAPLNNPLVMAICAELRAYIALSMRSVGKKEAAEFLWKQALPFMKRQHNDLLIARYQRLRRPRRPAP